MRFRHRLEYLGLKLIFLLVDHLPFALTYRGVPILADLWYRVSLARRRTAVENILRAGVVKDRRAAGRLARRSFCHMLWLALETLSTARFSDESDWHRRIRATISPETLAALERADQGIIMVSGHLGNWEIAVQLLSFYKPVYGITRNMNNPLTDRLIHDRKSRPRFILLPKHDLNTARFFQVLKQGNILAMMIDQYARARGMMVDFFGIPCLHPHVPRPAPPGHRRARGGGAIASVPGPCSLSWWPRRSPPIAPPATVRPTPAPSWRP